MCCSSSFSPASLTAIVALVVLSASLPAKAQMTSAIPVVTAAPDEAPDALAGDDALGEDALGDALGDDAAGAGSAQVSPESGPPMAAEENAEGNAEENTENGRGEQEPASLTQHTARVLAGTALGASTGVAVLALGQMGLLGASLWVSTMKFRGARDTSTALAAGFFLIGLVMPAAVGLGAGVGALLAGSKLWWAPPIAGVVAGVLALPAGGFLGAATGLVAAVQYQRHTPGVQSGWMPIFIAAAVMPVGALLFSGLVGGLAATAAASAELMNPLWWDAPAGNEE
jgi:hypothetical protein